MRSLIAFLLLATCTVGPNTTDAPPSDPAPAAEGPSTADPGIVEQPGTPAAAKPCNTDADCGDGICEGEGCGDMQGRCAPKTGRMCTRDLQTYCGCDGQQFQASGSCPGKRFSKRGECSSALPDGSKCTSAEQCESGICEGEGCGDDEPGTCAPKSRACTKDLREYCGCDGKTFSGSGSCPGKRFSAKGKCAAALPDGSKCTSASQCASGICEGEGCGDDKPGTCMAKQRKCTLDLRQYCGCDGKTHKGSGSCPGLRYAKRGPC
jgi:hypothetical protein